MRYRKLGVTGLVASEIAFGAEWIGSLTQMEVTELINHCSTQGINLIDIWNVNPHDRLKLGNALKNNRENWIIQGHIGATWQNEEYVRTREMDKVIPAFEDLLERLQTDYLDFGMIHYVDFEKEYYDVMNGEFLEYVLKLKDEGKINHIGLSTHNSKIALLAAQSGVIDLIMFSVNPAYDMFAETEDITVYSDNESYSKEFFGVNPEREEVYETCVKNNVAITVMKAYAGGRLFDKSTSPFKIALTPIQCIEYALTRPGVASVIPGAKSIDEIDGAIAHQTATEEQKDYVKVLLKAPKHSFNGLCTYCGHCAPCSEKINIAMVNKLYDLAKIHDEIPETVKGHYNDLKFNADTCSGCGDCMDRCPFNVDIVELMQKASKLFS